MLEPLTLFAAMKNVYDCEIFKLVTARESFEPSKVIEGFPFNPSAVKVGFFAVVACVA